MKHLLIGLTLISIFSCGKAKDSSGGGASASNGRQSQTVQSTLAFLEGGRVYDFDKLPLDGAADLGAKLWSGDSWPMNKGMINNRWSAPGKPGFNLVSPSKDELLTWTQEQISQLSPSEKLDILLGKYDYPLKAKVAPFTNPFAQGWESIGNGWASASMNHDEPTPKTLTNADGITIQFGSSDIKALLSYYYAFGTNLPLGQNVGLRCRDLSTDDCASDLNAGSFHLSLANKVGLAKQSFVMDVDRYVEVWNYPIENYHSEIINDGMPSEEAPVGATRTVRVKSRVSYVDQTIYNTWETVKGSPNQLHSNRVYTYDLHLNAANEIIGGNWKSQDRPDFIWTVGRVQNFAGDFAALNQLL